MRLGGVKYFLLFLAQAVLWNYFNFSQYIVIAILPAMILCLPISRSTAEAMLIAFVTGVAMDFLVTGQLGLTSFALVPVALIRRGVISLVFGSELFARGEELSVRRLGWLKFVPAVLLIAVACCAVWFLSGRSASFSVTVMGSVKRISSPTSGLRPMRRHFFLHRRTYSLPSPARTV